MRTIILPNARSANVATINFVPLYVPFLREPAIVLGPVKDASRRKRGGLRPSLTCPARAGLLSAGRDEGTGACSRTKEHGLL